MNTLPIKFRQPVFDQKGKFDYFHIWGISLQVIGDKVNIGWVTGFPHISDPKKSEQSTGTHDRFGEELYFNDIVQEPNEGGIGVLVWQGDCLGIASGQVNNYHAIDQVKSGELRLYTRVGNIYENPEMLQGCMFKKGMVFYTQTFIDKFTGKTHKITVLEVKPKSNELVVSWGRDNTETWDLDLCEKGILNGDYYF